MLQYGMESLLNDASKIVIHMTLRYEFRSFIYFHGKKKSKILNFDVSFDICQKVGCFHFH